MQVSILYYHIPSLLLALIMDFIFGDPGWSLHPVRCMGYIAAWFEKRMRKSVANEYLGGFFVWVFTLAVVTTIVTGVILLSNFLPYFIRIICYGCIIYFCLAVKDLFKHGLDVKQALDKQDIERARKKLALMVSRDTGQLDEKGVIRSVIESIAENMSDSAIAPVFYTLIFGPIGAVVYRVVNTMDAMFGYKNNKYIKFGFTAAKTDDLLNLIPSRISGILIALFSPLAGGSILNAFRILIRDRLKHASPNSGHPEAAVAGALGIQLGGPASYFGKTIDKPTIGDPLTLVTGKHIVQTCIMTCIPVVSILLVCLAICICLGISILL